jgi:hypothetical protein
MAIAVTRATKRTAAVLRQKVLRMKGTSKKRSSSQTLNLKIR